MALNLVSIKVVLLMTVLSVYKNHMYLLDVSIAYGMVGFLVVTILCRFILEGGRLK